MSLCCIVQERKWVVLDDVPYHSANDPASAFRQAIAAPDVEAAFAGTDGVTVTELKMEGTQAADYLGVVNPKEAPGHRPGRDRLTRVEVTR